jgi:hypothetical protein
MKTFIQRYHLRKYQGLILHQHRTDLINSMKFGQHTPMRIDWFQHPDRDEVWYKRELENLGSEEAFNRQYGNEFVSSSSLLLSPGSLGKLRKNSGKFIYHELEDFDNIHIDVKGFLGFKPGFDIETVKDEGKYWLFTIDIAEGSGRDYSVINVFEVIAMSKKEIEASENPGAMYDFFKLDQVAVFKSNEHPIEDFSKILYTLAIDVFNSENVKMLIEFNTYGTILLKYLQTVFPQRNDFDEDMILRFKHRHDSKGVKPGLRLRSDNKAVFCQNFKKLIEGNRININEVETVNEASLFGVNKSGNYSAQMGHDDLIMSAIISTEFFGTTDYADFIEEILDVIDEKLHDFMEATLYKDNQSQGDLQYDIYDLLS